MLLMRNAVHAALFLVVNFFCLAVMYLVLDAPFLFAVQIIVYAGAIMVLFLFVIMLLGVDRGEDLRERLIAQRPVAMRPGRRVRPRGRRRGARGDRVRDGRPAGFDAVNEGGNAQALAKVLFREYFFPFEVTSVLLIIAAIAAMVLGAAEGPRRHAGRDRARSRPSASDGGGAREDADRVLPGAVGRAVRARHASACWSGKNALIIFMSVELQLNAVNLALVAFRRMHDALDGQVLAFFSMVVAAAEVVVGLAIIVSRLPAAPTVNVDDARARVR